MFLSLTSDYITKLILIIIWPMVPSGTMLQDVLRGLRRGRQPRRGGFPRLWSTGRRYLEATYLLEVGGRQIPVFHALTGRHTACGKASARLWPTRPASTLSISSR